MSVDVYISGMDLMSLPCIDVLLRFLPHKPAAVRLLPPPPAPPRLEVLGTIQGLFFHHVKPDVVRPPSSLSLPQTPPVSLPSPQRPDVLGSIQGLFNPWVRPKSSPESEEPSPFSPPSQREVLDSIRKLVRHIKPAICRQLALPLAAHIARLPLNGPAAAALVGGGAAIAACQRYVQIVPYSNRVHIVVYSAHDGREQDEFEFAHFKNTNGRKILRPRNYHSVRVRRLTAEIVGAINRGLAIKSKHGKARIVRPHTRHLDDISWEVIVTKNDECNAEVYPGGGKIVIFEGLLDRFETDAEIAAVIAHEVGHVVQGYHLEGFYTPSRSRRLEAEADYIGIMLLAAAGFDPQVAIQVFDKFAEMERNSGYQFDQYSTHPPSTKRSQLLSQPKVMGEALQLYREVTANQVHEKTPSKSGVLSLACSR